MDSVIAWWTLLAAVTALGAASQAAIGLGFSLLTLPFYLLLLEVRDAVQLAMILTIAITAAMLPRVYRDVPRRSARNLLIGSALGFPLGLAFFLHASAAAIKIAVAITILAALAATAMNTCRAAPADTNINAVSAGALSGAMNAAIAMAGPAIALYLQAVGAGKAAIRAGIFFVYAFSYVAALGLQGYYNGVGDGAWSAAIYLLPVALLGAHAGDRLSARLSERAFRRALSGVLIAVALYLLYSVL